MPDENSNERLADWRQERYKRLRPHYDPMLCQREASVSIDGGPLCAIHAGKVALRKWLRGELVETHCGRPGATAPTAEK